MFWIVATSHTPLQVVVCSIVNDSWCQAGQPHKKCSTSSEHGKIEKIAGVGGGGGRWMARSYGVTGLQHCDVSGDYW